MCLTSEMLSPSSRDSRDYFIFNLNTSFTCGLRKLEVQTRCSLA